MPKTKSHARLSRDMRSLRPGDVITNLDGLFAQGHRILVLGRRHGTYYDFSTKFSGEMWIVLDTAGPWRWDDQAEIFVNKDGDPHADIGADATVLEGAGRDNYIEWFRELPPPESDRWFISPHHLIGTAGDPGTMAKMEALLARMRDGDDAQQIRNINHLIELVFAGTTALDARRMRLLHVIINSCITMAVRSQASASQGRRRGLPEGLAAAFFGGEEEEDSLPEGLPTGLAAMLAAAIAGRQHSAGSGHEHGPRARGNGHDHAHPAGRNGG